MKDTVKAMLFDQFEYSIESEMNRLRDTKQLGNLIYILNRIAPLPKEEVVEVLEFLDICCKKHIDAVYECADFYEEEYSKEGRDKILSYLD